MTELPELIVGFIIVIFVLLVALSLVFKKPYYKKAINLFLNVVIYGLNFCSLICKTLSKVLQKLKG